MRFKINLVLLIALLAVSTSSILARFIPDVPAVVISFWRLAIASALIWGYTLLRAQGAIAQGDKKLYLLSGIFLALHFSFFYGALKFTTVANATLLGITAPIFTILFERFVLKRSIKPYVLFGVVVALSGILIITGSGLSLSDGSWLGKIMGLFAALCIACVYILAEKLRTNTSTIIYTRALYTIAAISLLIISIFSNNSVLDIKSGDIVWLVALGVIPTILGHSLFYYSIKFTSPTIIASVPLGEPIIASVLAWIIFFEAVPAVTLIGGLLILLGVYLIITNSLRSRQSDSF